MGGSGFCESSTRDDCVTPSMLKALTLGLAAIVVGILAVYLAEVFYYEPRRRKGGR